LWLKGGRRGGRFGVYGGGEDEWVSRERISLSGALEKGQLGSVVGMCWIMEGDEVVERNRSGGGS